MGKQRKQSFLSQCNLHHCNKALTRVGVVISQAWAPRKQALSAGILIVDVEHGDVNRGHQNAQDHNFQSSHPQPKKEEETKLCRHQSTANPTKKICSNIFDLALSRQGQTVQAH